MVLSLYCRKSPLAHKAVFLCLDSLLGFTIGWLGVNIYFFLLALAAMFQSLQDNMILWGVLAELWDKGILMLQNCYLPSINPDAVLLISCQNS
jgi:hypothetical protein